MNENPFKRIANEYLLEYGSELRRELEGVELLPDSIATLSLDRRVRREIASLKRARHLRYTGLIAACLAVALLTPLILNIYPSRYEAPGSGLTSAQPAKPPAEPYVEVYEILPLTFNIPDQFIVSSVEQDVEKTVYHLKDSKLDDVVMTLERSGDVSPYDTLSVLPIGGHSAFGSSGNGYSLLAFREEESGVLFVLTCKHDINTLLVLSKEILI